MKWTQSQIQVYWVLFVVTFLAVAIWESFAPKRKLSVPAERRWARHGILFAIAAVTNALVLRLSPVAMATLVSGSRFGILNRDWLPDPVRFAATIILLDIAQYSVHWTFHHVGFLWRLHSVHHSDPDYDVSTAARFHPLELLVTQAAMLAAIALLAPPILAVFVTELLKVATNFAEHANASLPAGLEKFLRLFMITPDLHRIHHSEDEKEQSRNLGQLFPWWDRLLGTYLGEAAMGENFVTGLKGFQNNSSMAVGFMLAEPFYRQTTTQKDPV